MQTIRSSLGSLASLAFTPPFPPAQRRPFFLRRIRELLHLQTTLDHMAQDAVSLTLYAALLVIKSQISWSIRRRNHAVRQGSDCSTKSNTEPSHPFFSTTLKHRSAFGRPVTLASVASFPSSRYSCPAFLEAPDMRHFSTAVIHSDRVNQAPHFSWSSPVAFDCLLSSLPRPATTYKLLLMSSA